MTVTNPVTMTVEGQTRVPYSCLNVYAFNGDTYTGYHSVTDANGQVTLTLPEGGYHLRADYDGVQFWSSTENDCSIPGCTEAEVTLPGGQAEDEVTIDYTYDPLGRLTAANYADGTFFHYTYDAVGNRLSQETQDGTTTYVYDAANRLTSVDGVQYIYDANGNLLSDGANTYAYDYANHLTSVVSLQSSVSFSYNGLGDRLSQTIDGITTKYTLDINNGLTQVLADNTNTYLYGNGRISQSPIPNPESPEYYLGDALGSVRQLTDPASSVTLAQSYAPYGETIQTTGTAQTIYQFTGEMRDSTGLTYLRARYLNTGVGRFITRDTWGGNYQIPMSYNAWLYGYGNPLRYQDPSGLISKDEVEDADLMVNYLSVVYNVQIIRDWGYIWESLPDYINEVKCTWDGGSWRSLKELEWTRQAVFDVGHALGGSWKFKSAMRNKSIVIARISLNTFGGMAIPNYASWLTNIDVVLGDGALGTEAYAKFTIAHELGHVWDYRWGYKHSMKLMQLMGTWMCEDCGLCAWYPFAKKYDEKTNEIVLFAPEPYPGTIIGCSVTDMEKGENGCGIPYAATYGAAGPYWEGPGWEDWAESFASYVYSNYFPSRKKPEWGLISGGIRKTYIEEQINAIP